MFPTFFFFNEKNKNKVLGWRQGGCGKKYSQKIFSNSLDHKNSQKITKNHKKSQKCTVLGCCNCAVIVVELCSVVLSCSQFCM